ncbi:MAG: ribbon-helix-helix protein, CopG family [Alphaproteobacteria bacterium]|nr:ribbon-helix-helix protein, CopG family [Alphaproteobacteria bacterium]
MLSIRLSKDLEGRLSALSERTHRSKSFFVKKALEKFLEDEEEYQIAMEAYEAYLRSGKKSSSFEDVMKKNGLRND